MDKLCIFDLDRTLIDSPEAIFKWWEKIAEWFDDIFFKNREHFDEIIKKHNWDWESFSLKEFWIKKEDHKKLFSIWDANIKNMYDEYAQPYIWAHELLDILIWQWDFVAIATNNRIETIRSTVAFIINKWIPIYSYETHELKPAPNMINDHMKNFWIIPENTYMIWDENVDLQAAKAAKVKSILALYDSHLCPIKHKWDYDFLINNPMEVLKILETN